MAKLEISEDNSENIWIDVEVSNLDYCLLEVLIE